MNFEEEKSRSPSGKKLFYSYFGSSILNGKLAGLRQPITFHSSRGHGSLVHYCTLLYSYLIFLAAWLRRQAICFTILFRAYVKYL